MTKPRRRLQVARHLFPSICLVAPLFCGAAAGQNASPPTIVADLFDDTDMSVEILTRAKTQVARIYSKIGVEVLWTDLAVKEARGRFAVHLMIRQSAPRPRMMGRALGDSHDTGGTAFVYRDRVLDVARTRNLDDATMLAYAMAHEMGHLLLPYPSHSIAGIMQADWDGHDFRDMAAGSLAFTPAEASAIRARALRTGGVAAGPEKPLPTRKWAECRPNSPRGDVQRSPLLIDDVRYLMLCAMSITS